jgi:phage terminase large subunit-like protein
VPLSEEERVLISRAGFELSRRKNYKFNRYFPDCTEACKAESKDPKDHAGLCRVLYDRHLAFMRGTATHREVAFVAANQIGKTDAAAYSVTCHLTGQYPHWWEGRRFDTATSWWLAGDTMLSVRNILQVAMMGPIDTVENRQWSGMIPFHLIKDATRKSGGVGLCLDKVWVRHVSGMYSTLEFLSYDQGRKVFQGTGKHGIWLDEEPPDSPTNSIESGETEDIYTECLMRTITTNGIVLMTFTPLRGLTPFVQYYLETSVMEDVNGDPKPATEVFWPEGMAMGSTE